MPNELKIKTIAANESIFWLCQIEKEKSDLNRIESKRVFNSSAKCILCGFQIGGSIGNSSNTVLCSSILLYTFICILAHENGS